MNMPNFLVIGTQKAGTSALNYYLKEHPQIYMSAVKEPGFFDFEDEDINFCGPGDDNGYKFAINNLKDYQNLFSEVNNEKAIGEATTWYLQSPKAPARIRHHIPDAKLIAVLRNPVERAYSAYIHALRFNIEPISDFGQALLAEERRIEDNWGFLWHYQQMGFYTQQLKRYFEHFDRNQIKVYLYEDFNHNPQRILQDIFQFLNVDQTFSSEYFTRHNISGIAKSKAIDSFLYNRHNPLKKFLKPIIPNKLRKRIVNYAKVKNRSKPKFPEKIKDKLALVFSEDILQLEELIQQDLSTWLK